jgi:hypothetical protein
VFSLLDVLSVLSFVVPAAEAVGFYSVGDFFYGLFLDSIGGVGIVQGFW